MRYAPQIPAFRGDRTIAATTAHFVAGGIILSGAAAATATAMHLGPAYVPVSLGLYLALMALLAPQHNAVPRHFGVANRITLARAVLICLIGGVIAYTPLPSTGGTIIAWAVVAVALLAEALDGLDGWAARRQGLSSEFGARFDMETDSLFILLLAILVWRFDKVGAWVLTIGLMRYLFVLASLGLAALRRPLPPSRRRQCICVVQALALTACLAPPVGPTAATLVALVAVLTLTCSFAVDMWWLLRTAGPEGGK